MSNFPVLEIFKLNILNNTEYLSSFVHMLLEKKKNSDC